MSYKKNKGMEKAIGNRVALLSRNNKGVAGSTIVLIVCTIIIVIILLIFAIGSSFVKDASSINKYGALDVIGDSGNGQFSTGFYKDYWIISQNIAHSISLNYLADCFGEFEGKNISFYDVLGYWNETNTQDIANFTFKSGCERIWGAGFFNKNYNTYFYCLIPASPCVVKDAPKDIDKLEFKGALEGCGIKFDASPFNISVIVSHGCRFDIATLKEAKI